MIRFLQTLYVYFIPHFVTFYYLELYEGHRRVVHVVKRPDDVQPYYRDRIFAVRALVLFGKPWFARFVRN